MSTRRRLRPAALLLTLLVGLCVPGGLAEAAPTAPAAAAVGCGYHDYGNFYADPYMWISERRGTNSAGYCAYYVVVHNVRATGRKDCQWALYDDDGGFPLDSGTCPAQGGTVYSRSYTAAVSYRFVGSLFVLDSANQPHWAPTPYFP